MARLWNISMMWSSRRQLIRTIRDEGPHLRNVILRLSQVILLPFVLSGCTSLAGSDLISLYTITKDLWHGGREQITLEQASAVPYASIGISVNGGAETLLILTGDVKSEDLWTSGAGIAISTQNGRIIRTAGFPNNLNGYESSYGKIWPSKTQTFSWQADFFDLGLYSVPITCHDRIAGDETITILGKEIPTRRIEESCKSEGGLTWSFDNTFWIDPADSFVWRSIQHVHPHMGAIETEILRPPN